MNIIAVRVIGTKERVGIFWAKDWDGLLSCIDEITDPSDCEYLKLKEGGIGWPGPTDGKFPTFTQEETEGEEDILPDDASWARNSKSWAESSLLETTCDQLNWWNDEKGWKRWRPCVEQIKLSPPAFTAEVLT